MSKPTAARERQIRLDELDFRLDLELVLRLIVRNDTAAVVRRPEVACN